MIRIMFALVFLMLCYVNMALAQVTITNAARHEQQGNAYLLRNQYAKAIKSYGIVLELKNLSRDKRAAVLSDRGVAYWRLKMFDKAIADFTKSLESKEKYPQSLNNRGNVHLEMGNLDAAIADFSQAILLAPDYGISYINRGNAYYLLKDYILAKQDFRSAMRLLPNQAIAYHGSGLSNIALNRNYAALRNLNRALILNKSYKMALLRREDVYTQLEFSDKALADLSRSIKHFPEDQTLLVKRAKMRYDLKQYYAAINDTRNALKLAPGLVDAHILRGMAYGKIKKYRAALKELNRAIEDDPDRVQGYIHRAEIYNRKGDLEKAKVDLNTALELEPANPEAFFIHGRIAEKRKDEDTALAYYRRAVGQDQRHKKAREGIKRLTGLMPEIYGKIVGEPLQKWQIIDLSIKPKVQPLPEKKSENETVDPNKKDKAESGVKAQAADGDGENRKTGNIEIVTPKTAITTQTKEVTSKKEGDGKPKYTLINPDYPYLAASLEMYGIGKPRLLEWTKLKKPLSGFGLIRYFAGYQDENKEIGLEYIGVVDLKKNRIIAIEPYKWGGKVAKWSWRQVSVVVTDSDGIASEVFLKKRRKSNSSGQQLSYMKGKRVRSRSRPRQTVRRSTSKRKRNRNRRRKKNKGIFDWLF